MPIFAQAKKNTMNKKRPEITLLEAVKKSICKRALFMYILLDGYRAYHDMESERHLSMTNISYEDAEKLSDSLHKIMNLDCETNDFLYDKEEHLNGSIEAYNKLQEHLSNFDNRRRKAALAFYKHIYHDFISIHFALGGWMTYPDILVSYLSYVCGTSSWQELKDSIIQIDIFKRKREAIDSMYFRKDIQMLEKLFYEIYAKQAKRLTKKSDTSAEMQ